MKILIRSSDNRVVYAGNDIQLSDAEVSGAGWRDSHFNLTNSRIEDVTLPEVFSGGIYAYAGGNWEIVEQERYAEIARPIAKASRQQSVERVRVIVSSGKEFDGDEISQTRMCRAIIGMQAAGAPTIEWTLANNLSAQVTLAELTEALILSGQEQSRLWRF